MAFKMNSRQEHSGFHMQCLIAVMFGLFAIGFFAVISAYMARSNPGGAKLDGLLAATPFALTATAASVVAFLIHRGKRVTLLVKALPIGIFVAFLVVVAIRNAI